ncbi:TfuA-like protein [Asanoa sp. NPDC049518]|uniref:TfuA-like protein n=1 Tax=unclassified Asanoa TaxID=2685164 RepID=UPI003435275E
MTRPVVFVGPSLHGAAALARADIEFLPPVRRGDIDALLSRAAPPPAIGIIDGAFFQSLSVSPKEVLRAIDAGVRTYGSSSIGALRAVECAPYGMVGVGRIYEAYQSGRVSADDEVAITYDDETGRALSEPLVNLRFAIEAAQAAGVVDAALAARFLAVAKRRYFPERTVALLLHDLTSEVGEATCAPLRRYLTDLAPDTKRDDGLRLLDLVVSDRSPGFTAPLEWPPPVQL